MSDVRWKPVAICYRCNSSDIVNIPANSEWTVEYLFFCSSCGVPVSTKLGRIRVDKYGFIIKGSEPEVFAGNK